MSKKRSQYEADLESPFTAAEMVDEPTYDPALRDFFKPHDSFAVADWGPSLTRQEFVDECDINQIMLKYERTGVLPGPNAAEPMYVDFTQIPDNLADSLRMMDEAQTAFMQLPATIRREFDNNALAFTEFAMDPTNLDQMRDWGLAKPKEPAVTPPVSPPAPPPAAPPEPPKPA